MTSTERTGRSDDSAPISQVVRVGADGFAAPLPERSGAAALRPKGGGPLA
jgi:hypothetical protein